AAAAPFGARSQAMPTPQPPLKTAGRESILGFMLATFGLASLVGCCILIGRDRPDLLYLIVYLLHSTCLAAAGLATLPLCCLCGQRQRSIRLLKASSILSLVASVSCVALLLLFWRLKLYERTLPRLKGDPLLIFLGLFVSLLLQLLLTLAHCFRCRATLRRLQLPLTHGTALIGPQVATAAQGPFLIVQQESANQVPLVVPSTPASSNVPPLADLPPTYEEAMSQQPGPTV
ncbi:hypothetical protein BOX15_Mlig024508g1, partial [Macrostomum lignano]